jgi:DNA-binding transcriptional MerR regulator
VNTDIVETMDVEFTVDELAQRAAVPVRTIREYQTMGVLPPPQRRGRIGVYDASHLARLELIARLQERGYSLAGIRDLVASWHEGADLADVLGLPAGQLVHLDEPGASATLQQLARLVPDLVPGRIDDLLATRVVQRCGDDRFCVPSPSLLSLAIDALAAGYPADRVLAYLTAIRETTDVIAASTIDLLADPPADADPDRIAHLATRGRGLLARGLGRLTIYTIGTRLDIDDAALVPDAVPARS